MKETESIFEAIKKVDGQGKTYWTSRELCSAFGYSTYQKFSELTKRSIDKAKTLGYYDKDLFNRKGEMVGIGSGAQREKENYYLTYKACQFIASYADRKKQQVEIAKSYFSTDNGGKDCDLNSQKSLSFDEKECIKARNKNYWERMTAKASEGYKSKMKRLSNATGEEKSRLLEDFRRDDSYLGKAAPHHIMYKLGEPLKSKDGCRAYEFLIEYDIYEPTVGIYYGCKGLTLKGDHNQQIEFFNKEWEEIEEKLAKILSNTFPGKSFVHRFKLTNNANNSTYWPFWITLYEEEDIVGVAARATRIIKNVYKKHFGLIQSDKSTRKECINETEKEPLQHDRDSSYMETDTAFTEDAYKKLMNSLSPEFREKVAIFFIKATNKRYLEKDTNYEKAWRIINEADPVDGNETDKIKCKTYKQFIYVIKVLFDENNEKIAWEALSKVLLNQKGNRDEKMRSTIKSYDPSDLKDNAQTILSLIMEREK